MGKITDLKLGVIKFVCLLGVTAVTNGEISAQKTVKDSTKVDSVFNLRTITGITQNTVVSANNLQQLRLQNVTHQPYISLQQMLKGNLPGVYIQEPSGEPGTIQNIFVRGVSTPMLSKRELYDNQAVVFVNGVPLSIDKPFAYDIQQYDFNRIGTGTNLYTVVHPENIESIEVIKDPARLAALGPIAANGAIWVLTKNARSGRSEISVNSYFGYAMKEVVTPVNAAYENAFRLPYYDKFGTQQDRFQYPAYLQDSSNSDYYGTSNWTDLYYRNGGQYNVDLSLTGGTDRANFRFFGAATSNGGNADKTALNKYITSFGINVLPLEWLTISTQINASIMDRTRNRNFRDRLAEARYLPDISNPLTPDKKVYGEYLSLIDQQAKDDNRNTSVYGYFAIGADLKNFTYSGRLAFDYNEATRDVFNPEELMDGNNFVSNYFGYNQRIVLSNILGYTFKLNEGHKIHLEAGQNYQTDINKFDYAYAYNGPNNFIKLNIVNGNPNETDYLNPVGFRVYYFPSKTRAALASFHGKATYSYKNAYEFSALVRRDGSSALQPDNRWTTNYAFSGRAFLKENLFKDNNTVTAFDVYASYSRLGHLFSDDRFSRGPNLKPDLTFTGNPALATYNGLPGLSRPYNSGWVGYGIPWMYSDNIAGGISTDLFAGRLSASAEVYSRTTKNQLLPIPVPLEWGYTGAYYSGLTVNNTGVDVSLAATLVKSDKNGINWSVNGNINYNRNELKALPKGLKEVVIGANKLEVGKPIDAFWVYVNEGIYNNDAEIPTNPATSKKLSANGIAFGVGDAKWKDLNGDYVIDEKDKQLVGNYLPKFTGGFGTTLSYKSLTLNMQFYMALGHKLLNQYASNRLDFINNDTKADINAVKEITFWEKKLELSDYPMYNPWSDALPYRTDQSLFVEDASFVKLRSASLHYDILFNQRPGKKSAFSKAEAYLAGTNLFTITKFKGDDPELVQYNGVYNGYGLPIPKMIVVGLKLTINR
jgi:TonB-linked SusC/RagA family outer membrane protein